MLANGEVDPHYAILVGDVGTGKSTLVEKLTGETGRSSALRESVTKISETFLVPDGSLMICDTPGTNAMPNQVEQNLSIANAFNLRTVSR